MDALSSPVFPMELLPREDVLFEKILPLLRPRDWVYLMKTCKRICKILKSFFVKNKTLKMHRCSVKQHHLCIYGFSILTKDATNLRILDISGCSWMSANLLLPILKNNKKLRKLDVSISSNSPNVIQILAVICSQISKLSDIYPKMDHGSIIHLSNHKTVVTKDCRFKVEVNYSNRLKLARGFVEKLSHRIWRGYQRTCLLSRDEIQVGFSQSFNDFKVNQFMNMAKKDMVYAVAVRIDAVTERNIEFAKLVPGFLKLPEEIQLNLLKAGCFEMAVIWMSRYFDLSSNHVLFVGEPAGELDRSLMLPLEAFTTSGITEEITLVSQIFDCVKTIAQLKLSEVALSLYSAFILMQADRPGLKNLDVIEKLKQYNHALSSALEKEILRSYAVWRYQCTWPGCSVVGESQEAAERHARDHLGLRDSDGEEDLYYTEIEELSTGELERAAATLSILFNQRHTLRDLGSRQQGFVIKSERFPQLYVEIFVT